MTRDRLPRPDDDRLNALLHAADEAAEAAFAQRLDPQEFVARARYGLVGAFNPVPRQTSTFTHGPDDLVRPEPPATVQEDTKPIDWVRRLSPIEKALLERLASGSTVSAAATAEFLSLRTANRKMAELRRRAGVTTTRELVGIYRARR